MGKHRVIRALLIPVAAAVLSGYPALILAETIVWNTSSGAVDGYIVYWGTSPNDRSNSRNVGDSTQYDLNGLPLSEGVAYYLSVSAYNAAGESPPCTPVVFTPGDNTPPLPPVGLTTQ